MASTIEYRNNTSVFFGTENSRASGQQKAKFSFQDVFSDADCFCSREEEVFQYFQRVLSDKDTEIVEKHLQTCSPCVNHLVELQKVTEVGESSAVDGRKADEIFQQNLLEFKKVLE